MKQDATVAFFDLHRAPFGKEVDVDDLWLDPSREDAVDRLVEAMHRRQHALVRGEPGVGKRMLKLEKTAKVGIKTKRLREGWDESYLERLLALQREVAE